MHHFTYRNGEMYCEDVPLREIAERFGTPAYIYSAATLTRHFEAFDTPFSDIRHLTCFSVKACSNIAILRLFANLGGGFDVVSGGELFRVIKAGGDPAKVMYAGVGKTEAEIAYALNAGIMMFNVESEAELEAIARVAAREKKTARVALRVNPEVDPHTHPYIATGLREAKFGIDAERSLRIYLKARDMERIEPVGVDCHIGSQLTQTTPFMEALLRLTDLVGALRQHGLKISWLDLGGGLGITYRDERPPLPKEYAEEIMAAVKSLDVSLILEPGRVIVGNAAVLLTRTLYVKDTDEKRFLIIDAAMNDCIRPSLYGAYHELLPVLEPGPKSAIATVDVVGPICESTDFLAKNRPMPPVASDELIAMMSAGAYCASMASNYNSRPRAPEVLVSGKDAHLVREREIWDDLVAREKVPDFLAGT